MGAGGLHELRERVQEIRSSKECVVRLDKESNDNHKVLLMEDVHEDTLGQMV